MFFELRLPTTCLVTVMVCLALSYVILQPAPLFEFFTSCKHNTNARFYQCDAVHQADRSVF
jgi:hypothetical protein